MSFTGASKHGSENAPMQPADRSEGGSDSGRVENKPMTDAKNAVTCASGDSENNRHDRAAEGAVAAVGGSDPEPDRIRLRWVLWRLYAAHGPKEVPEGQIPIPPMRRA